MISAPAPQFRVVVNEEGRHSLWPAEMVVPSGWKETLTARPRTECLEYVRRAWTALRVKPRQTRPTMQFGLMFFGGDEGDAAREKYEFVIDVARFADANGFAGVWLPERHFTRMGSLFPNPAVLHAAVARETKNIRLRSGSVVLPLNDPIRVAEEWALVDNLSNGRVELSYASGWNAEDFALAPGTYAQRYETMFERIPQVDRLWSGQTIEVPDGTGQPIRVRTYPTPVQKTLPKWLTAAGSLRTFEKAGELGVGVLTHLFDQGVEDLGEKIAAYRQALDKHGWGADSGRVAVTLHTFVADDLDHVRKHAYLPYREYLKSNMKLLEKLAQSRNVPIDISKLSPAELDAAIEWIFEKFLRHRSLLGTIDGCVDLVNQLARVGVQEIACLIDFGPSPEAVLDSLPKLDQLRKRFEPPPAFEG